VIRQSFQQLWNLKHADEIWPVSPVNERELLDRGFDPSRLHAAPLAVETPSLSYLEQKALSPVDILFVGRIVRAKGVLDLLQGLGQVHRQFASAIRVRIVGNVSFSDRAYVDAVRAAIATAGFPVEFLGTVDDERLHQLYRSSHVLAIPSYHEGFCKPVVEALRAGCIPVGYSAHNLPNVAGGLGRLVATGDIAALGEALAQVVDGVAQALASPERECLVLDRGEMSARGFDREAKRHVEVFSFDKFAETARHRIVALSGNGVGHPHG